MVLDVSCCLSLLLGLCVVVLSCMSSVFSSVVLFFFCYPSSFYYTLFPSLFYHHPPLPQPCILRANPLRLDIPPFLSYAGAYALFNYHLANPSKGLEYPNLRLVRAFERGLDPKSSEAGFILTHVDMVKHSSDLVAGAVKVIDTLETGGARPDVNEGFREILRAMERIEASMEGMSPVLF